MLRRYARLAPLAAVCAAGCFATRNDVRLLQGNIQGLQAQIAQLIVAEQTEIQRQMRAAAALDSARKADFERAFAQVTVLVDSLAALSDRVSRDRASTDIAIAQIGERVSAIREAIAAGNKQMRDALADIDKRAADATAAAMPDSATMQAEPTASQMYRAGFEQLRRGSYDVARSMFEEVVQKHPTSVSAGYALFHIGDVLVRTGQDASADSVLASVVTRYPKSDRAPTALLKQAEIHQRNGRPGRAKELLRQLIKDYPSCDEIDLARDRLAKLPPG